MGQIILSILPVTMKSPVVSGDEEEDHDGDDSMTMMTTVRTLSLAPITITLLPLPAAGFLRILRPAFICNKVTCICPIVINVLKRLWRALYNTKIGKLT